MTIFKDDPFSRTPDTPLYQQLYTHLRAAILSGELKRGLKLPSTRALADELNVSRNTVLNAYAQLMAEGYLESVIHCIGWLPDGIDDLAVVRRAAAHGLDLSPVSHFSLEPLARQGLLLGYGGYSVPEIKDGVRRLAAVLHSV